FHRIQIRYSLIVLQTVKLSGLWRTETTGYAELHVVVVIKGVTDAQFGCQITEGIGAVSWTVVTAATHATRSTIITGTAGQHFVVVVVAHALKTQAQRNVKTVCPELLVLHKRSNLGGVYFVVVVFTYRYGFHHLSGAGCRISLELQQVALGELNVQTGGKLAVLVKITIGRKLQAHAVVGVVFCRQARQEVLDKVQIGLTVIRSQNHIPASGQCVVDAGPYAQALVVAIGFRVRVLATQ